MKKRTFIKRTLYGIFFGCAITVVYIQNSSRCAHIIIKEFQNVFKKDFGGYFSGQLVDVSLLPLSLTYKNISATPVDKQEKWRWKAERLTIGVSVLSYFFTGKYDIDISVYGGVAYSEIINNKLSLLTHINRFFVVPKAPLPLSPEKMDFKKMQLFACDKQKDITVASCTDALISWDSGIMNMGGTCYDGYIKHGDTFFIKNIQGTCSGKSQKTYKGYIHPLMVTGSCVLPQLPEEQQCIVMQGAWDGYKGTCFADNQDNSLCVKKIDIVSYKKSFICSVDATCNVQTVSLLGLKKKLPFKGDVHITCSGTPERFSGNMYGLSLGYNNHICDMTELFFTKKDTNIFGAVTLYHNDQVSNGTFSFDTQQATGDITIKPTTEWNVFNEWYAEPYTTGFTCTLTEDKSIKMHHTVVAQHKKTETKMHGAGTGILTQQGIFTASGVWGTKTYQAKAELLPHFKPHFVWCKNKKDKTILTLTGHYPSYKNFDARLSYSLLRGIMREAVDYDVPGEGDIICRGSFDDEAVSFSLSTADSTVAVPETYNFISDFHTQGTYNYKTFKLALSDLFVGLHKGILKSSGGYASFDNSFKPIKLFFPLSFNNCFFNVKKDFFVLMSGDISLKKEPETDFLLDGDITLDKGQLKENPLSLQGQKEVTQFMMPSDLFKKVPLELSLNVVTRHPVYIDTPFLKSRAVLQSYLHNTLSVPYVSGKLSLKGGLLQFPYKPLSLLKADITFLPHEVYDPLVNIVARSTIKKYNVTLTVTGSLQTPHISLDSVPYLTEEQIVALLFTGTVEETLPGMVPVLVVHSLETLLFGATDNSTTKDSLLKDSLKKIRFVPRLADKTGKGEIRGAIEIDVNDRLHAMIEKNFSLSEDTRFEVEYIISDDMSIKGIKDERGDIGGELEMRFKL